MKTRKLGDITVSEVGMGCMAFLDFKLTDGEMEQIASIDKNERYYHRTDEQLVQFAGWKSDFEKA